MTAQRLSRIAAGIAIVTALGVAGLVTRNVLWPDDPDASLQRSGGKVLGDMAGYVGRVDREARTVDISASPLGIRPVVLLVTNDTAIVVNGKQGAIGDLWKDLPVRVFYEVRDNTRYATSIQVTAGEALAASPVGKDAGRRQGRAARPWTRPPVPQRPERRRRRPLRRALRRRTRPRQSLRAPSPAAPPTAATRPASRAARVCGESGAASGPGCRGIEARAGRRRLAGRAAGACGRRRRRLRLWCRRPRLAAAAPPPAPRVAESVPAKVPATTAASAPATESASVGSSRVAVPRPAPGRVGRRRVRGDRLAPEGIRPTLSRRSPRRLASARASAAGAAGPGASPRADVAHRPPRWRRPASSRSWPPHRSPWPPAH